VAQSVVHESLCSRVSGSLGFVWLSQWFARIHVAAAVVHGRLFGRVSGIDPHEHEPLSRPHIISGTIEYSAP
jgi:hypothetical protein